jgi:hypothetical protein
MAEVLKYEEEESVAGSDVVVTETGKVLQDGDRTIIRGEEELEENEIISYSFQRTVSDLRKLFKLKRKIRREKYRERKKVEKKERKWLLL